MKKLSTLFLALLLVLPSIFCVGAQAADVTVFVDGVYVEFDVAPQIINDRTMVPMRAIFEQIGAQVEWDDSTKTAISTKGDITVKISIGEYKLNKNGVDIAIDVPAQIVDSRTLVPVRAISESFDCQVFWDDATRSVRVVTLNLPEPELTEDDKAVYLTLGTENPIEISKATYNLYANMLPDSDEAGVIEYIRTYEGIYKYHSDKGMYMEDVILDAINTQLYNALHDEVYSQLITTYNTTDAALRDYLAKNIYITCAQEAEGLVQYTDAEILAFARENYIRVKHILVKDEKVAQEILEKAKAGESFEALVTEHSIDSMNVESGYVFNKGKMVAEFETAAFALAEGEISNLVPSTYGYHIIKKYPMSEITDEYILSNLADDINMELNNAAYSANVKAVIATLTVNVNK